MPQRLGEEAGRWQKRTHFTGDLKGLPAGSPALGAPLRGCCATRGMAAAMCAARGDWAFNGSLRFLLSPSPSKNVYM